MSSEKQNTTVENAEVEAEFRFDNIDETTFIIEKASNVQTLVRSRVNWITSEMDNVVDAVKNRTQNATLASLDSISGLVGIELVAKF